MVIGYESKYMPENGPGATGMARTCNKITMSVV